MAFPTLLRNNIVLTTFSSRIKKLSDFMEEHILWRIDRHLLQFFFCWVCLYIRVFLLFWLGTKAKSKRKETKWGMKWFLKFLLVMMSLCLFNFSLFLRVFFFLTLWFHIFKNMCNAFYSYFIVYVFVICNYVHLCMSL